MTVTGLSQTTIDKYIVYQILSKDFVDLFNLRKYGTFLGINRSSKL